VAEVQLAGVESVGLDSAVAAGLEIAVLQVAEGDGLTRGLGQCRPAILRPTIGNTRAPSRTTRNSGNGHTLPFHLVNSMALWRCVRTLRFSASSDTLPTWHGLFRADLQTPWWLLYLNPTGVRFATKSRNERQE